ncbi:MAG TPA: PEGA domain-containing protein, partial [Rhizomicrobium sp.]|nr:PEGA domain-containing protein [Rhizomicrobium sp.]
TIRRPAGKYQVLVKADDYDPATVQTVELKAGARLPPVNFALNRIVHTATVAIESAPPESEVLLDGSSIGTAASGAFKKEVSPGNHTITIRKPDYVDFTHYQQFAAGQSATISAADMKPFGKLLAKVTPESARVTYKRAGETEAKPLSANGAASIPPGDYVLESKADGFMPDLQNIAVAAGKEATYAATLHPVVVAVEKLTPQKVFANGSAWTFSDPDGWWACSQKGFSFLKRDEGTLTFTIAKDPKPFVKERVKKYEFVADYKDEENKITYSLDGHHLTKKIFVNGKEIKEARNDLPISAGDTLHFSIQILPDTINVKVNGTADTTKRPELHGKFGFINEVVLMPR